MNDKKSTLRLHYQQKRDVLFAEDQTKAAQALANIVSDHKFLDPFHHIALYLAHQGEIDTTPLIAMAFAKGKKLYLPIVDQQPKQPLTFARFTQKTTLIQNRYGILEPETAALTLHEMAVIELMLMPLVAFDEKGTRLGMGQGHFDRTLAQLNPKPILIGLAHSCQAAKPTLLPADPWDVPLDGVITNEKMILFSDKIKKLVKGD